MVIFAWILWSIILGTWVIGFVMFIAAFLAYCNGRDVTVKVNWLELGLFIAFFVFLSIYLFG